MLCKRNIHKLLIRTIPHITLLFWPDARAEESSILTAANVVGSSLNISKTPDFNVLISGKFHTTMWTVSSGDEKELLIDLGTSLTLHTVFISNWQYIDLS